MSAGLMMLGRHMASDRWLQAAVDDPRVRERYDVKVARAGAHECWYWLGALHEHGHGRFWVGAHRPQGGRRRDVVVIAHRFGWALAYGLDALNEAGLLAHTCDEASCENPAHSKPGTVASNYEDWLRRRWTPGSPLRDRRGPGGRARAIREAILAGGDAAAVAAAKRAGLNELDQLQQTLW